MKKSPLEFYIAEKESFESALKEIQSKLRLLSVIRFLVFCATVFFVYYFLGDAKLMTLSGVVGGVTFVFFLKNYLNLKYKKNELEELVRINTVEIEVLNGHYFDLETGEEYLDPSHMFSYDIDLFGRGSFFQYSNRTATAAGRQKLVNLLTSNDLVGIEKKQEAIKELAEKPKWRQRFSAVASLIETENSPNAIVKWIRQYTLFLPKAMQYIPNIFSVISVGIMVAMYFDILAFGHLLVWFFLGLGITGVYLKNVSNLYNHATKAKDTFQQYYKLLEIIEETKFSSKLIEEKYNDIYSEGKNASAVLKIFSKALEALDQRNNIFLAIIGNALFLWDLKQTSKIEKWISMYGANVEKWFEVVSFFDAQNTLSNFAFNHPENTFPKIVSNAPVIDAKGLGHPLIANSKRVTSNCVIDSQDFFIVTGANMAGKSTFLRTVSLNIVMANSGLPVCAGEMKYSPVKLITSMRTTDSLADDTSYFFSELKRLKFIVEALKDEHYFIILDEILKGTNSTDKAIGSQKFVEKLVGSNATGIIATHDLSLCEIEEKYTQIKNYYFDAEIVNDELHFDYRLKDGICQNMNASFLLRKMEIV